MTLPVSVIIPCYHQEQYLNLAIESVVKQADDITIVYDNADGGYWGDTYGNVGSFTVGRPYRAGVCYARNMGIDNAKNNLILCLDADDRLYPDALQRLYSAWQPNTWVYGDSYTEIDESEAVIHEMQNPPPAMIFRKNLSFNTILFSRDDWAKVGGYDVNFDFGDEDYSFQVALTDAGVKPVRYEGAPIFKRMIHEHSRTERAIKYFPMVLEMLREKYPGTMKR